MPLYFAYGSNMDKAQMSKRCPSAVLVGVATLRDYELAFTIYSPKRECGCADIVSSPGNAVYGLLYELSSKDMEAMDVFEGHPIHYQRIETIVLNAEGKPINAFSYEVVKKETGLMPSGHYLGLILNAAIEHTFPEPYIKMLKSLE